MLSRPFACPDAKAGRLSALAAGSLLLLLGSVSGSTGCMSGGTSTESRPGDPTGRWVVVAHRMPGTSALDEAGARVWHGREMRYGPALATFGRDTCHAPAYVYREVKADSLLAIDFRLTREALGLEVAEGGQVGITDVTCGHEPWIAPGARLLWIGPDRALTMWDGVFFELERKSSP